MVALIRCRLLVTIVVALAVLLPGLGAAAPASQQPASPPDLETLQHAEQLRTRAESLMAAWLRRSIRSTRV
jgi:hypothetical protein